MSWTVNVAQKLNFQRLDILFRAMQGCDSFNLNASSKFFNCVSLRFQGLLIIYHFKASLVLWGTLWYQVLSICFLFHGIFERFLDKIQVFDREILHFFTNFLQRWHFGFSLGKNSPASVIDLVMTTQDFTQVEHVKSHLVSSCLASVWRFILNAFLYFSFVFLSTWSPGFFLII